MVRSLQHTGNRGSCRGYNFEVSCLCCKKYVPKTIYSEENKFSLFLYFLGKDIGPAEDYMYGLSTHIHTELKHFMDRLSVSYVLYTKSGEDNT